MSTYERAFATILPAIGIFCHLLFLRSRRRQCAVFDGAMNDSEAPAREAEASSAILFHVERFEENQHSKAQDIVLLPTDWSRLLADHRHAVIVPE